MKTSAFILSLTTLIPNTCISGELRPANLVSPLRDQSAIDGCSWSASSSRIGKGYIFLAEYDQSRLLMNIDGVDTELRRISTLGDLKRIGSVMTDVYRSKKGAVVYSTYRTTWLCPVDGTEESCEVTRFDVTFEITTGTRRQVVHTKGDVGC